YINDVRLDNVRQLLRETDKAIGVIAQEIGFADHSHMTRAYKKKFGITPKQERNSKKEKNSGPAADDRRY
ncbi:MAG: helix-turn-helix transcriptional regulator, partial [Halieaceae bacterium]|nr:helix-turn-helix transcriptional regulator [Halieaceae bacterium]